MELMTVLLASLAMAATLCEATTILLDGGTVISYDESTQSIKVLRHHSVLIENDRIVEIYPASSPKVLPNCTEIISTVGKIISPGFIDTHKHGWQTAFRTIGSNTTLADYSFKWGPLGPSFKRLTPDDVYYGQLLGAIESLNAGVTGILDYSHATFSNGTSEASLRASIDAGARTWWSYAFFSAPGTNFSVSQQMNNFRHIAETTAWDQTPVELGIAYDSFSSEDTSEAVEVLRLAQDFNVSVVTTHYLGGPWFFDNSPKVLNDLGFLNNSFPVVFAHCSFMTTEDAVLLRKHNHYVSITPESEMHYGHDHPVSHLVQDQAALGVDTHFTYSSDIVTQARIWLQLTRLRLYKTVLDLWKIPVNNPMSANQAFLLATRAGGLALRRHDVGVLQVGAKADIAVFDGTAPNLIGWYDPVAAVILHSNPGNVEHVLVDGQFRKRDFQIVNSPVNLTYARQRFEESARRLQQQWLADTHLILYGTYMNGVQFGSVENTDVISGIQTGY